MPEVTTAKAIVKEGALVQWDDDGWHRGRIMIFDGAITTNGCRSNATLYQNDFVLIKHSITGLLEFVPFGKLEFKAEVHPE